MKLRQFNKDDALKQLRSKQQRNYNVKTRTLVLSIGILILSVIYFTYARYETSSSDFTIIDANVTNFQGSFTVTLDADGGELESDELELTIGRMTPIGELEEPTKVGYTFEGWYYSDDTLVTPTDKIRDDITIYAHYNINSYTITYDANSGTVEKESDNVDYNNSLTLPTPTKSGYTFLGWYDDISNGNKVDNTTLWTEDKTIYAHWVEGYLLKTGCGIGYGTYGNKLSCIFTFDSTRWDTYSEQVSTHSAYVKAGTRVNIYSYYGSGTMWYGYNNSNTSICSNKANFYFYMLK